MSDETSARRAYVKRDDGTEVECKLSRAPDVEGRPVWLITIPDTCVMGPGDTVKLDGDFPGKNAFLIAGLMTA